MSTDSNLRINIITEHNDKGSKAAQKSLGSLEDSAVRLGTKLAAAFSVAEVLNFSRKSIQAFAKEDAALKVLAQTLGNVGLAFKTVQVSEFITTLAESTGVMKTDLFPAFETLIRYTGDVTKAQDLLKLSLDVSAGTGKDTAMVALALGKAYGGNTVALGRLGAGLTKAELSSKNFALVQERLSTLFKGDASAAADSYQGKINRLKVAFEELQVKVGEGLVTALGSLGNDTGITTVTGYMDRLGQSITDASNGVSALSDKLSNLPGLKFLTTGVSGLFVKSLFSNAGFDLLQNLGKKKVIDNTANDTYSQQKRMLVAQNAITVAKKAGLAVDQKALQAAKDKAALEKASAALKLAGSVFDMGQIEALAALQRNVTSDEAVRLNLQLALLTDNADAAAKLSQQLIQTQREALLVQWANPFVTWTASMADALIALNELQIKLEQFAKAPTITPATLSAMTLGQDAAASIADLSGLDSASLAGLGLSLDATYGATADALAKAIAENGAGIAGLNTSAGMNGASSTANPYSWFNNSSAYNPVNGNVNVTVMLDGNQVTSYINNANQNTTVGGTQLTTSRINQAAIG